MRSLLLARFSKKPRFVASLSSLFWIISLLSATKLSKPSSTLCSIYVVVKTFSFVLSELTATAPLQNDSKSESKAGPACCRNSFQIFTTANRCELSCSFRRGSVCCFDSLSSRSPARNAPVELGSEENRAEQGILRAGGGAVGYFSAFFPYPLGVSSWRILDTQGTSNVCCCLLSQTFLAIFMTSPLSFGKKALRLSHNRTLLRKTAVCIV